MLGDIEEAFGFLLFERNARGMTPTPLGVVTLAYARRALAELTRLPKTSTSNAVADMDS
jgi:Transcriptional regulator